MLCFTAPEGRTTALAAGATMTVQKSAQLTELAGKIAHRVSRHLTRKGWLEGENESAFLSDRAAGDDGMDALRISSITYRIATGKNAGPKVVTLQTLPGDCSVHAGVAAEAHESQKLEKLCRYITRPGFPCGG